MLRVLKFYQKGYRIPLDSLGRVIGRLVLGTEPPEDTLSRLAKEAHLGEVLTTLLREVDPGIDPGHQAHLPAAARKDENP